MLPFISRCITYLKKIFHKKPVASQEIHKQTVPVPTENIISEQEEDTSYTQEQYELFKECQIGDLLWALMPLTHEQLDRIAKDHQIRPYFIVKKKEDCLIAYASTTTPQHGEPYTYHCYPGYSHGKNKISYLKLETMYVLPIKNLRTFMMHMPQRELRKIEKRILLNKLAGKTNLITLKIPIHVEKGDVISLPVEQHIHYYYIYQDDQQNLYGMYLIKGSQRDAKYMIRLQKVPYVLDFQRKQVISRKNNMKVIGILNSQQQEEIANIQKNIRRKRKNTSRCTKEVAAAIQYTGCRYVDELGDEYVFLYTWHDHRYGVCLNTFEQYPSIVRIKKNIPRLGRIADEEVIAIIHRLKERNGDFHHQLDTTLAYFEKNNVRVEN